MILCVNGSNWNYKKENPYSAQIHAGHRHGNLHYKNRPGNVREVFKSHSGLMSISAVTLGGLIYGAEKSVQPERNLADIEGLTARLEVLPFDDLAATHFGQLRAELAKIGKPIGPYDQMIAGHARSLGLILVTNNLREFGRVPGLRLENWVD